MDCDTSQTFLPNECSKRQRQQQPESEDPEAAQAAKKRFMDHYNAQMKSNEKVVRISSDITESLAKYDGPVNLLAEIQASRNSTTCQAGQPTTADLVDPTDKPPEGALGAVLRRRASASSLAFPQPTGGGASQPAGSQPAAAAAAAAAAVAAAAAQEGPPTNRGGAGAGAGAAAPPAPPPPAAAAAAAALPPQELARRGWPPGARALERAAPPLRLPPPPRPPAPSQYNGVYPQPGSNSWLAQTVLDGKYYLIGAFAREREAALAHDRALDALLAPAAAAAAAAAPAAAAAAAGAAAAAAEQPHPRPRPPTAPLPRRARLLARRRNFLDARGAQRNPEGLAAARARARAPWDARRWCRAGAGGAGAGAAGDGGGGGGGGGDGEGDADDDDEPGRLPLLHSRPSVYKGVTARARDWLAHARAPPPPPPLGEGGGAAAAAAREGGGGRGGGDGDGGGLADRWTAAAGAGAAVAAAFVGGRATHRAGAFPQEAQAAEAHDRAAFFLALAAPPGSVRILESRRARRDPPRRGGGGAAAAEGGAVPQGRGAEEAAAEAAARRRAARDRRARQRLLGGGDPPPPPPPSLDWSSSSSSSLTDGGGEAAADRGSAEGKEPAGCIGSEQEGPGGGGGGSGGGGGGGRGSGGGGSTGDGGHGGTTVTGLGLLGEGGAEAFRFPFEWDPDEEMNFPENLPHYRALAAALAAAEAGAEFPPSPPASSSSSPLPPTAAEAREKLTEGSAADGGGGGGRRRERITNISEDKRSSDKDAKEVLVSIKSGPPPAAYRPFILPKGERGVPRAAEPKSGVSRKKTPGGNKDTAHQTAGDGDGPSPGLAFLCTACGAKLEKGRRTQRHLHPLLDMPVCKTCLDTYNFGEFTIDEDGKEMYCRWCGDGGDIFPCDRCPKGFCRACVERNFGPREVERIESLDGAASWACYVCDREALNALKDAVWGVHSGIARRRFAQSSSLQEVDEKGRAMNGGGGGRRAPPAAAGAAKRRRRVVLDDVSLGRERTPLPAVNDQDNEMVPMDFVYVTEPAAGEGVTLTNNPNFLVCCDCTDQCQDPAKCACAQLMGGTFPYTRRGRQLMEPKLAIYECNWRCRCHIQLCRNRNVGRPNDLPLEIFRTPGKGWGVRCRVDILAGTYVTNYLGEIVPEAVAEKRGVLCGDEYLFNLDMWASDVARHRLERLGLKDGFEAMENEARAELRDSISTTIARPKHSIPSSWSHKVSGATILEKVGQLSKTATIVTVSSSDSLDSLEPAPPKRLKATAAAAAAAAAAPPRSPPLSTLLGRPAAVPAGSPGTWGKRAAAAAAAAARGGGGGGTKGTPGGGDRPGAAAAAGAGAAAMARAQEIYDTTMEEVGREMGLCVDAKWYGNVGRFLNHSCDPNLCKQTVFVETHDVRVPRLAFFALWDVPAGAELTYDYGYLPDSVEGKQMACRCGSSNCRGRMY